MKHSRLTHITASLVLCACMAGCASRAPVSTPDEQAQTQGYYKIGQPYKINGQWYYPREDYSYDETGVASWYGDAFHDKLTANGEIYNKNELTAAHKTLPMPSLARVTNLENGKSIVVRVNDRGPFSGSRIIDMSERSAELLGFKRQGTAKVRVQVLSDESKAIADAMRRYGKPIEPGSPPPTAVASSADVISQSPLTTIAEPVESRPLQPVRSTNETRRELMQTKPLPYAVQLPVTGKNQLYIQAGAFTISENAHKLKQNLSRIGPTVISKTVINGTTFYRVRLGPIATIPKADALLVKVRHAGAPDARTIVD